MMYTTLNEIRLHSPCSYGWEKLLKHLEKTKSDDAPLSFLTILGSNGLDDALWCLRAAPKDWESTIRMFAVWCAKQVEHLMTDERSKNALLVAQNHALGLATDEELAAAAGDAAWAARAAARAAADAAWAASWAARAAARAAAGDAAWSAADAAGDAADAAMAAAAAASLAAARAAADAAWVASLAAARAAADAARDAARAAQKEMFIAMCEGKAPWQVK